jgi:uncharacterized protein (DUF433 family)
MEAKSAPFSMRLSPALDAAVTDEARRTRRSKGAIVEGLAEEALRMRLFPGIAFRGADWERRPWVIGTALDVWQIVDAYRDFGSVEAMAAEGGISASQVRLALAYHQRFPNEIDEDIARNRRGLEELSAEFPFIDVRPGSA